MNNIFDRAVSAVIGLAAVTMAASVVHRELIGTAAPNPLKPEYVKSWQGLVDVGIRTGPRNAPIQIVEFADFECPVCKEFEAPLSRIAAAYPGKVARIFLPLPLVQIHKHAAQAVRSAECANDQGRFASMHDLLYTKQDSLGIKDWVSFAIDAGVADTLAFRRCVERTDSLSRVLRATKLATSLGVHGTPTVLVNGWKYPGAVPDSIIARTVEKLLEGKHPAS